ncbi:MAG: hypothetical protein KFW21_01565 [Spirochaetota bacterium]|nr:hypothetical protein [Spirochaetota bacterium]
MAKINYIATSHGMYAESTVSTLQMLTGDTIPFVSFLNSMSKEDLKRKYLEIFNQSEEKEFVFFVDISGGTPFNVLLELKYERKDLDIKLVTGLSLLMLIEILENELSEESIQNIFNMTKIITELTIDSYEGEEEE